MKQKPSYILLISFISVILAGVIGGVANATSLSTWYVQLAKPSLVPPGYVFGIVWSILYFLMALSLFLVWQKGKKAKWAVGVFYLQLGLNTLWSIIFFGFQSIGLGLVDIILLLLAIIWTIVLFYQHSKIATYLMLPYLVWVIFATYLNVHIYLLNR